MKAVLSGVLDADPGERPALLDRLCGPDTDLRDTVESLLAMESKVDPLDTAASTWIRLSGGRSREASRAKSVPTRILQEIGRGGMGVVYLADRADGQYRKRVAIKLITCGPARSGSRPRFRRERQILAQLEHPSIARLLDGGATDPASHTS